MKLPVQVTFRQVPESLAIKDLILTEAEQLDRYFSRIIGCRVLVESPHRSQRKGKLYHVRIEVKIPGKELVVKRDPGEHAAHTDVYLAIRDAFHEMRRQLQDYTKVRRGYVKHHEPSPHARVKTLFPTEDYGFLEEAGGAEIYFHRNSVLGQGFDALKIGDEVRFAESEGDEGRQASTVERVGAEGRHDFPHRRTASEEGEPSEAAAGSRSRAS